MNMFSRLLRDPYPIDAPGGGPGAAVIDSQADGEVSPAWLDILPEEARQDPNVTKYKTPEDFYAGYKSQVEMIGKKGVIIPGKDAKPEEMDKFFNALGRPTTPGEYKYSKLDGLHSTIEITPELTAGFSAFSHKLGLTNQQADEVNKFQMQTVSRWIAEDEQRQIAAAQQAETGLRQEWGSKYDANKALIVKGVLKAGGQEAMDAMGGEKGIGNNTVVLKMLGKLFSSMSEDQINAFDSGSYSSPGVTGEETKEQALAKINEMMSDPKHPINDLKNPKRDEAIQERLRLYKIAYPTEIA